MGNWCLYRAAGPQNLNIQFAVSQPDGGLVTCDTMHLTLLREGPVTRDIRYGRKSTVVCVHCVHRTASKICLLTDDISRLNIITVCLKSDLSSSIRHTVTQARSRTTLSGTCSDSVFACVKRKLYIASMTRN